MLQDYFWIQTDVNKLKYLGNIMYHKKQQYTSYNKKFTPASQ